jgi:tetratricopeptide (TPR) repeat protein
MTFLKRLRLASGILGCAAIGAAVSGIVFGDAKPTIPTTALVPGAPRGTNLIDELAKTRFSEQPTLAYQTSAGETLFAWQIKPALTASAKPRPRDVLVMVDTSASQSGEPLKQAVQIMATLARQLTADDRVDIWTINLDHKDLTRSVSGGFKPAGSEELKESVTKFFEREYGAGAVDLKAGLEHAVRAFDQKAGRQQVILYLGDGESAAGTAMTEPVRAEIGNRLVDKDIQFFAVPLGTSLSAENLHGLTTLTGGSVVRVQEDLRYPANRDTFQKRLIASIDVPVLKADKVAFGPADAELYPNRLPPLRADRSTLLLGKLKGPAANLTLKLEGTVGDSKTSVDLAERLPAAQRENFFLNPMLMQWQTVEAKNTPALLPADRTLAMASEQFRLYRDEFVELGIRAIKADRFDHAEQLFKASAKIDPNHGDATEGLKVVADLRAGALTKEKLQERVKAAEKAGQVFLKQEPGTPTPGGAVPPPPAPGGAMPSDLDKRIAARNVAEQEAKAIVEETLKRAKLLRGTDPDTAYDDLKRQRDTVIQNGDLSDNVRRKLAADLEVQMRDIQVQGGEIKRRLAAERDRISAARYRLTESDRLATLEEQTKARIDRFRDLMSQARFELAYQEAQVLIEERINRGQPVPPEVAATYRIGQSATSLREYRELKRVREDRYLLTMLQVEKSFIPYPDEPPMHFPPASVWRELRTQREKNVNSLIFGTQGAAGLVKIRSIVEDLDESGQPNRTPRRVNMPLPLKDQRVKDVLEKLEKDFGIRIVVRYDLLNVGDNPDKFEERKFKMDVNLSGLTLGAFLDIALLDVGASYFVRPEYIEVTTKLMRIEEKVTRAFSVGDLALIPPNAVNNQALQQNLAVFGAQVNQAANLAGAAAFQGFGGFQGGQGQQPGLPGAGMAGMFQGLGQGGGNNLGVGGGFVGATGGQLGQFGNLGGQFGIQGNNQSSILVQVISQLVARGEWETNNIAGVQPNAPGGDPTAPALPANLLNSIGYYPPTNALIIRATSRYHPTASFKIPLAEAAPVNVNPNIIAKGNENNDPQLRNPVADARAIVNRAGKDPKKVWNETFDWAVTDPNLIVSATEVLFALNEHAHAAEAIKASLRHGHANAEWTHEALAIALQSSQASPIEVERAAMSAVDLAPRDPKAYLRAAKAESELGQHDAAVGLCKKAASIEPNLPTAYANALVYLERSGDAKCDTVAWAAANLLSRDWANDGTDYAKAARERVLRLAGKLTSLGRDADAAVLTKTLNETKTRDLVIELAWQGTADLELHVAEPNGSVCSPDMKRTVGGGVLRTNLLDQKDDARSATYTAAEAFSGSYKVSVKTALGRAIGNKASLKVIRHAGTPDEVFELFDIDLSTGKPAEFVLEKGSRTDLASLPPEEISPERMLTTAGPRTLAPSGFTGGSGRPDSASTIAATNPITAANTIPLVRQSVEVPMPSNTAGVAGMRMVATVGPDKKGVEYSANAVFAGPAVEIPVPKMRLLPGANGR